MYKENSTRWRFCDHCSAKSTVLHEFDEQCTRNRALTQFDLLTAAVYTKNGPQTPSDCSLQQCTREMAPEGDSVITAPRKAPFRTNMASSVHEIMPSRSLTCSLPQCTRKTAPNAFRLLASAVYKENGARWRFCDHCSAKSAVSNELDEQRTRNHALKRVGPYTAAVYKTKQRPSIRLRAILQSRMAADRRRQ